MKKSFLTVFLIITLVFSSFSSSVFALDANPSVVSIESSPTKSAGTVAQPQWLKSWIVKKSMQSVAYALQNWWNTVLKKALMVVTSESTANLIINQKYYLWTIIAQSANSINLVTTNIRLELYNQFLRAMSDANIFTPQIRQSVAWALSQFLDLVAL